MTSKMALVLLKNAEMDNSVMGLYVTYVYIASYLDPFR